MKKEDETWEKNVPSIDGYGIKIPSYTYWNLAYALTLKGNFSIKNSCIKINLNLNLFIGVEKLLEQDPLKKLIPVDELCPIMFDKHPK